MDFAASDKGHKKVMEMGWLYFPFQKIFPLEEKEQAIATKLFQKFVEEISQEYFSERNMIVHTC